MQVYQSPLGSGWRVGRQSGCRPWQTSRHAKLVRAGWQPATITYDGCRVDSRVEDLFFIAVSQLVNLVVHLVFYLVINPTSSWLGASHKSATRLERWLVTLAFIFCSVVGQVSMSCWHFYGFTTTCSSLPSRHPRFNFTNQCAGTQHLAQKDVL